MNHALTPALVPSLFSPQGLLVHLRACPAHGTVPSVKNGPALGGYGAIAMKDTLTTAMTTMPPDLLRSLTWDRGKELSAHA